MPLHKNAYRVQKKFRLDPTGALWFTLFKWLAPVSLWFVYDLGPALKEKRNDEEDGRADGRRTVGHFIATGPRRGSEAGPGRHCHRRQILGGGCRGQHVRSAGAGR